jgi:hypothetical protein
MNANALARNYAVLTPEERFRLILAANTRGDEAERDRLVSAGGRITLSMPAHAPYAHAFNELATLIFLELLEEAARYLEALDRADFGDDGAKGDGAEVGGEMGDAETEEAAAEVEAEGNGRSPAERSWGLALAAGFMLRTKADGWGLFCQRMSVPPFALWECLPGFDRLRRALALAEEVAFVPEGFLRWLNVIRPAGAPELAEVPLTVEGIADATARLFQARAAWWGGE